MNEIRVKRMVLAGLAMLVVFLAAELFFEHLIGKMLFGDRIEEMWLEASSLSDWTDRNQALNLLLPLLNCTVLIWLYASLRPMYGVGTKTALITSAFVVVLGFSLTINLVNLGLIPAQAGFIEGLFEAIEIPIAMIAGAGVYEGTRETRATSST